MTRRVPPRERLALLRARVAQHQFDEQRGRRVPRLSSAPDRQEAAKAARVDRRRKLTPEDEAGVRQLLARGTPQHDIAHRYGVDAGTIQRVRSRGMLPKPRQRGRWVFRDGKWVIGEPAEATA